ncbi:unnamed protein product [Rhizopus stolonifer]
MASTKDNKKATKANAKTDKEVTKKTKAAKVESESSENESSSAEEEASSAEEEASSDEASSEEEEEEESKGTKRKAEDEEDVASKAAKTEDKFTIWCGGISFEATEEQVREFFAECGEIAQLRLRVDEATGKNRGFCHIDFATQEGKDAAIALSGQEFLGRNIRIDGADGGNRTKTQNTSGAKKVFVANLNRDFDEDAHRKALTEAFAKFGTLVGDVRLPYNRESGGLKGIGYIEFETSEQAEAAVKGMSGVELNGRPLRTDLSGDNDRERFAGNRGGRGGRGGFRGGRGDFRGGRGGRGGNRGGFRGGRN